MNLYIFIIIYFVVNVEAYRGYYSKWKQRKPLCTFIKCEPYCNVGIREDGCLKCVCGPKCPELACPKSCKMKKEYGGPCLTCDCKVTTKINNKFSMFESLKRNPKSSVKKKDLSRKVCLPTKCPRGCVIEKDFHSRCPFCKCEFTDWLENEILCPPWKCPQVIKRKKLFRSYAHNENMMIKQIFQLKLKKVRQVNAKRQPNN